MTYVVLGQGSEDSWGWRLESRGIQVSPLFHVSGMDGLYERHDLDNDGAPDFTSYVPGDADFEVLFARVEQRDYVSGPAGYHQEIPVCASARNALARQRLAYAIEANNGQARPTPRASNFLRAEMTRLATDCPAN